MAPHLATLIGAQEKAKKTLEAGSPSDLAPIDAIALPEHGGDPSERADATRHGEKLLAAGRVAILVVAGGQGTRLGFAGPKGAFPLGPVTHRCLFELQAQKIAGLSRRSARPIPWYILTSPATDLATRELFERKRYFNLSPEDVFIFPQGCVPAFDLQGRLLLERPDRIFENPDGHGGALPALHQSGALEDMERRGVDTIFYYQVDNPLVAIGDPTFVGFHDQHRAEMSCKVVRRSDSRESIGVLARQRGRASIVEYTEIDEGQRTARNADGELVFWAGNPAIHLFSTAFARKVAGRADEWLPYHASLKKVPSLDAAGMPIEPSVPNAVKLERFVFDALPCAERVCLLEANARDEFSPVKNAQGPRSPCSCRRDLVALYRRWLKAAGLVLPPESQWIEIDHSHIDGPEEAIAANLHDLAEAPETIRVARGNPT